MRRVLLAITGTIAGLVALLSFKSHSGVTPSAASVAGTSGGSSSSSGSASGGSGGSTPSGAYPEGLKLTAGEKAITGKVANTAYGPVQVELAVSNNKIVKVGILQQPLNTEHDVQIGQMAFPTLIRETITAQNGKIDSVSGATYTSGGYIASLQSAVDKGL
jgi:hypothetical protein